MGKSKPRTLGAEIRRLREYYKLSLRELARRLSISAPYLSDIERGQRFPSSKVLEKIARELKVELPDLTALLWGDRPTVESLTAKLAEANKRVERLVELVHDAKFSKPDGVQVLRINNQLGLILTPSEMVRLNMPTKESDQ